MTMCNFHFSNSHNLSMALLYLIQSIRPLLAIANGGQPQREHGRSGEDGAGRLRGLRAGAG